MNKTDDLISIGRFGRTHGIKGDITIVSYNKDRCNIFNYKNWLIKVKGELREINPTNTRVSGKYLLAHINGYDTIESASSLTNIEILIQREELPKLNKGEFYWYQLIGMQVVNESGMELGEVHDIIATGANDVLVIKGDKKRLIPYLKDRVIIEIDENKRQILVDWDAEF